MDDIALDALYGSIEKWERIVAGTDVDKGADNCPLCRVFHPEYSGKEGCIGCPVREKTGKPMCHSTPHDDTLGYPEDSSEYRAAAQRELDFLRSLLPESIT